MRLPQAAEPQGSTVVKGVVMGSMRAFRCQRCRAEMLARVHSLRAGIRAAGMPSILCCGVPVRAAEPEAVLGDILTGALAQGRAAHCPCCGFSIRLVVHPLGRLVCRDCRVDFLIGGCEETTGGGQAGASTTFRSLLSPADRRSGAMAWPRS